MTDSSEQMQMIEDCEVREEQLSDWEGAFIDSLKRQLVDGRTLSQRQEETLEKIWDRVTSKHRR